MDHRGHRTVDDYNEPVRRLITAIDAKLEEGGWDQPPELVLVGRHDEQSDELDISVLAVIEAPGWHPLLRAAGGDVGACVETYASFLEEDGLDGHPEITEAFLLPGLCGVALAVEAWMLSSPASAPSPEYLQAAAERKINEHPDRIEARLVVFAPLFGGSLVLMRLRGEDHGEITEGNEFTGRLMARLERLASALATEVARS